MSNNPLVMRTLDTAQVPLSVADDGTIRVAETRVSLDSVVHHYQQGATAEEITLKFPTLRLADVHACLAFYLNNQKEVDRYIARQLQAGDELQKQISEEPAQQQRIKEMRARIKARAATREQKTP